jgi:TctA family transporter
MDPIGGHYRFTYGRMFLQDGLHIIPIVIGLIGLREVLVMFQTEFRAEFLTTKIKGYLPTREDFRVSFFPILSQKGFSSGENLLMWIKMEMVAISKRRGPFWRGASMS